MLPCPLRHADHEGRAFGVLHDAPHLVHHQQAGLGVLGRRRPHRLGADHRCGGPKLRLKQAQVEHGDQRLVGEQVVALVGQQVAQAARCEGPQQPCEVGGSRLVFLKVLVEVPEAGTAEDEANWLAGALLLLRDALVRSRAKSCPKEMACDEFGVSRQMLEFRMRITGVERQFSRGTRTVANR